MNILERVIEEMKEDLRFNDTTVIYEMLKSLYTPKTHEIFKQALPEEQHINYEEYDKNIE